MGPGWALAIIEGGIGHARIAEMRRLGVACGARAETFAGLAGWAT
ncbi:MAG: hypothetical protein CM1200mP34_3910 [Verrucomicrobiales bacterium]|nr:MAG: hypothetical protein CM1200mP34_3910 [Verrucomicrobiales bacterium]